MPEGSATLGFPREIRRALDGDHSTIVKYSSEQDNNFQVVSRTIAGLIRDAITKDQGVSNRNRLNCRTGKLRLRSRIDD